MKPEISIIVPIYNVEKYLSKCIESILNQTFTDFELILVNDGSKDGSGKVCDEYALKDNRIKVIHKINGGVSSARNSGINLALGRYIGFVDPDDYIRKDMYEKLYYICKDENADISICKLGREINGNLVDKEDTESIIELNNIDGLRELFKGILYRFSLCNKLFERECFRDVMFPEGRIHEDLSTTYKLFANAKKSIYLDYTGYIYVKRENSILTTTYNEKRLQAFIGWDEILEFMMNKYPMLEERVVACFGYACIDHINYIINQVIGFDDKYRLLNFIRNEVKKRFHLLIRNKILTNKMKITMILLSLNSRLLIILKSKRKK
ncbi:glycosyltransferase [Clostridium sp. LIBA-8841]|uniref:glycosyltransferase n=1 Tax=Clostridium sp. LIBA-8841 TaxID=2987530 RepID=UPI002AC47203|nr:glycosyltransferase [Clostridium sp. LIBA-8841]MDZ5254376.1 glycosyltransferase [Clostridium sp. LIBA-8841]